MEVIDVDGALTGDGQEGEVEISLHALFGSFNPCTLCLSGTNDGQQVMMLIDNGNTHNFIQ